MEEINVTVAARNFSDLLNRVAYQGVSFDLKRGGKSIACLIPASPAKRLRVIDLNNLFTHLPHLGEDADAFVRDIQETRESLPLEQDTWD